MIPARPVLIGLAQSFFVKLEIRRAIDFTPSALNWRGLNDSAPGQHLREKRGDVDAVAFRLGEVMNESLHGAPSVRGDFQEAHVLALHAREVVDLRANLYESPALDAKGFSIIQGIVETVLP